MHLPIPGILPHQYPWKDKARRWEEEVSEPEAYYHLDASVPWMCVTFSDA